MVKRNTAYADIITDVTKAILSCQNNHVAISIINEMLNEDDPEVIISLAYTLNYNFHDNIVVSCLRMDEYTEDKARFIARNLSSIKDLYCVHYYNNILIFISSDSSITDEDMKNYKKQIISVAEGNLNNYHLGVSSPYESLKYLRDAIEESLMACKVSKITKNKIESYDKIGSYKLLLDIKNKNTLKRFYYELLNPIIEYDECKNGKLVETLLAYVENDGDMKKTAKELFQHENTIRYRILKIRQLLDLEEENITFYENIILAYKISKIIF